MSSTNNSSAEPSKANASYNQTVGSAKQTVGSLVDTTLGTDLQQQGQTQYNEGVAEQKAAEAEGYIKGTADRVEGKINNVVGAVTGDRQQQAEGQTQHDKGILKQDINSN
ncbi:hypothetical protein EMMF5_003101 [Cystobasidiomycetes sp. EMM_F5]